ncbi:MAG TPA: universal stress protein [Solirubrobacteraceae bacterium]|nr:universal stress protein [Solirubrobacteraceae bacterium]
MPEGEGVGTQERAAPAGGAPLFADILCAIDGKEGGFSAVEQAVELAGSEGRVTSLVVTSYRSGGPHRSPAIGPMRAAEILEHAGQIARDAGVPFVEEVDPRSPPARVILDWSERFELLALGAPASSWPSRLLSVGVGDRAMGGFTNALLMARPLTGDRRLGDRIVVASDGSEDSQGLVELAGRLARSRGSQVTLVHALGREPVKRGPSEERERTLSQQEQTLARAVPSGKSELLVRSGRAASAIVSAAAAAGASLVVMGSRRLDGLRAMGSVSRRVAHQAPCSVLLVPPEAVAHQS